MQNQQIQKNNKSIHKNRRCNYTIINKIEKVNI